MYTFIHSIISGAHLTFTIDVYTRMRETIKSASCEYHKINEETAMQQLEKYFAYCNKQFLNHISATPEYVISATSEYWISATPAYGIII